MASLAEVDIDGAARYIGKYLHMQSYHVREYIMSGGRVFRGCLGSPRWFNRNCGVCPDQKYLGVLVKLARNLRSVQDKITPPRLMKMEGLS
jgi:hypothetical protein